MQKFEKNKPYKITMPKSQPFTGYFYGMTDPEDDLTCDICESGKAHRTKKHGMYNFVTTINNEIPLETPSKSNITSQYFFGNSCIKKVNIEGITD